jgi:hypothetical protein
MASDAITVPVGQIEARPWVDELHQWLTTVDHKRLGILYILSALLFLLIGGVEALIIRIQLMHSHNNFVSPEVFNQMFAMHGTTMIFFVVMPVMFGFVNYLVLLMIGARDMAFPRLNAFSFWLSFLVGLLLYFSFVGGSGRHYLLSSLLASCNLRHGTLRLSTVPWLFWEQDSRTRMGIRIRAFGSCCTPAADGLHCLSSTVVRAKRDVMQSRQMIQYTDIAADFERSDTSANMFEMDQPRAGPFR